VCVCFCVFFSMDLCLLHLALQQYDDQYDGLGGRATCKARNSLHHQAKSWLSLLETLVICCCNLGTKGASHMESRGHKRGQNTIPNTIPLLLELKNPKNPWQASTWKAPNSQVLDLQKGHEKLIKTHLHHSSCLQHITLES
jgi:hypothetical protein